MSRDRPQYTHRKNIIALAEAEMKAVAAARERECKRLSDAENDTRKITGKEWVGRRVMVWNAEANYPSGAMCNAWVARYSKHNRKVGAGARGSLPLPHAVLTSPTVCA